MRLIDADTLIKKANYEADGMTEPFKSQFGILVEWLVDKTPTIEPERKKGKWIYDEDSIIHGHCSCCGFKAKYQETDVFGCDFCPKCGAEME